MITPWRKISREPTTIELRGAAADFDATQMQIDNSPLEREIDGTVKGAPKKRRHARKIGDVI